MTSFHHQPEAQHPKSSAIHKLPADYPIFWGVKRTSKFKSVMSAFDPEPILMAHDLCSANLAVAPIPPVANPCCNALRSNRSGHTLWPRRDIIEGVIGAIDRCRQARLGLGG